MIGLSNMMFWQNPKFHEWYYNTLDNLFQFDKRTHFFEVDFAKPWWHALMKRKWRYGFLLTSEILQSVFESLIPIAFGAAISFQRYDYILYIVLGYVALEILNRLAVYSNGITTAEVSGSIQTSAQIFFLTVDPLYHATKSSGAIVSKMQAGGREFGFMINTICFHILPTIVSYITVTATLIYFNGYLGLVSTLFFLAITLLTSFFRFVNSKSLVKKWITSREKSAAMGNENLIQNALIRSSFATVETIERYVKAYRKSHNNRNIMFMGGAMVTFLARMFYILSVLIIGYGILDLVQKGNISAVVGTTIILTYMSGSRQILRIGDTVGEVTESMANIADLFQYIRDFGTQTFPVLPSNNPHDINKYGNQAY